MKPSRSFRWSLPLAFLFTIVLTPPAAAATIRQQLLFTALGDVNTRMGISLASGGDLNGDGWPDVVAGATGNGSTIPRVYIFFGGPTADGVADFVITPGWGQDYGQAVMCDTDLNGDGHADLAVGSFHDIPGRQQTGRVYIYFGGTPFDTIPDLIPNGEFQFDDFGNSLGAADVNGDGFKDLVVGAWFAGAIGRGECGKAYVLFGGPLLDATPDVTFVGEADHDWFGGSVAGAGDVNRDGYEDVLVSAMLHDARGSDSGRAYLFYGGAPMDAKPDRIFDGERAGDLFGHRVAGAGDVNGDGYDDFLISALQHDGAYEDDGRSYLYFGGRQPNVHSDLEIDGEAAGDELGRAVPAGDINADGYADIVLGSMTNDSGGNNAGRVYLLLGGHHPDAIPDLVITGAVPNGWQGRGVAAGDMNGDGYGDLALSGFPDPTGGPQAGRVSVVLLFPEEIGEHRRGPPAPLPSPQVRIWPSPARPGAVLRVSFAATHGTAGLPADLDVGVYDLAGRRIATMENGPIDATGAATFEWKLPREGTASGLYLVRAASLSARFVRVSKLAVLE